VPVSWLPPGSLPSWLFHEWGQVILIVLLQASFSRTLRLWKYWVCFLLSLWGPFLLHPSREEAFLCQWSQYFLWNIRIHKSFIWVHINCTKCWVSFSHIFIHVHNVLWSHSPPLFSLVIVLLTDPLPLSSPPSDVMSPFLKPRFLTWKGKCGICIPETGLFWVTWWSPGLFSSKWHSFILLYGRVILHCVHVTYFPYGLVTWWAPRLIP
jgi:hypothetical protein